MKALVVASKFPPEYAGPGYRICQTYRRLADAGTDVDWKVICNSTEFAGNASYSHDGIPVRRISSRLFHDWYRLPPGLPRRIAYAAKSHLEALGTRRALSGAAPEFVHVLGTSPSAATAISWARRRDLPLVIELVTDGASPYQRLPGLSRIGRPDLTRRTLVIAISEDLRRRCRALGLTRNVWVRPNPVDEARFHPDFERGRDFRRELTPFGADDHVLVSVAKIMPQKNQAFLLEVLARLPSNYKLVLAGPVVTEGPLAKRDRKYLARIRESVIGLGLEERVHLVTEFVDSAKYMKLADVSLMPSHQEGLGTPLLESLAAGVPVIANRGVKSFQQWINDAENGFLCELAPEPWVRAVERVVGFGEERRRRVSRTILAEASASRIDAAFMALVNALVDLPSDGILDVESVLKQTSR